MKWCNSLFFSLLAGNLGQPLGTTMRQGSRPCNELNANVFGFSAGSGRQLARAVVGQ